MNKLLNKFFNIAVYIIVITIMFFACLQYIEANNGTNIVEVAGKGNSMYPTITDNSTVSVDLDYYKYNSPEINDLVVVVNPVDELILKRVVATEGAVISQDSNKCLTIDGQSYPDVKFPMKDVFGNIDSYTLKEDEFWILGDNREHSACDSRSYGAINYSQIYGKAISANGVDIK